MNIKTKFLAEYVNFVDNTKKQNKNIKILIFYLWLFYVCSYFLFYFFIIQNSNHTIIKIQNMNTCYYTKLNE